MRPRLALLLLVVFASLVGCGRLRYQALTSDASDTTDASDARTGEPDASVDATMGVMAPDALTPDANPSSDAGVDGNVVVEAGTDAGVDANTSSDASADSAVIVDASLDASDAAADAATDAGTVFDPPPCAADVVWETDFASDPTLLDRDVDLMSDWIVRGGGTFPSSELAGGTWTSTTPTPLDTNPPRNITTTTFVDVRMRSLRTPAPVAIDFEGALFWVNVDYTATDFAPLFVSVSRTAIDQQEVRFYGKSADATSVLLLGPIAIGPDFVHVQMAIDPATSTLIGWIEGSLVGSAMFPRVSDMLNNDRFATAFAASTPAEYDHARVVVCAP